MGDMLIQEWDFMAAHIHTGNTKFLQKTFRIIHATEIRLECGFKLGYNSHSGKMLRLHYFIVGYIGTLWNVPLFEMIFGIDLKLYFKSV